MQYVLNYTETRSESIVKCWGEQVEKQWRILRGVIGYLCLLLGLIQKKNKFFSLQNRRWFANEQATQ
jgi:hypothetical protein